jgi:hypothetical protein
LQAFIQKYFICFQTYVAIVLIWMLHMFSHICYNNMFQNVSSVLVFCCSKYFYIASCKCSIRMLHMFSHICCSVCSRCFICFRRMLHSSVSCCTCFILFGESEGVLPSRQTVLTCGQAARETYGRHGPHVGTHNEPTRELLYI